MTGAAPALTVSVVTVCLNAEVSIGVTMASVARQGYPHVEHVIVDGGSRDGTVALVKSQMPAVFVSEPDEGIYYAMEKGAKLATGDVVFFLNSGDRFFDEDVIGDVVAFFNATSADAVFGNLLPCYLNPGDTHDHGAFVPDKVIDLTYFSNRRLFYDECIHHQTTFYRRHVFRECSFICTDNLAANGEYYLNLQAFVQRDFMLKHVDRSICRFALGGASTANFAAEWSRFNVLREYLRKRFFPRGQRIPRRGWNEYLEGAPPLRALMLIASREWRVMDRGLRTVARLKNRYDRRPLAVPRDVR